MKLTKNEIIGLIQYTSGEMKEDLIDITEQDAENILNEYLEAINYPYCCERLKAIDITEVEDIPDPYWEKYIEGKQ
jgi:hypothetical protein